MSHSTRAYIQNADGLKGFLVPANIIAELLYIDTKKPREFVKAEKHYQTKFVGVIKELEDKDTNAERMRLLERRYPAYFVLMIK